MENKPYAILVLSHKSKFQLERIISFFEFSKFQIYVHLDKNAEFNISDIKGDFISIEKQLPCSWGDFNVTLATFDLLKFAFKDGKKYFFLISGEDFPIKTLDYFNDFVLKNIHKDFFNVIPINLALSNPLLRNFKRRFNYVHVPNRQPDNAFESVSFSIKYRFKIIQQHCDFLKFPVPNNIYVGVNWFNLCRNTVEKMLVDFKCNFLLKSRLSLSLLAEESLPHSIFWSIHDPKMWVNDSLRYTKWIQGKSHPEYLKLDDIEDAIKSESLFARKFNELETLNYLESNLVK
ncbi:beta-1,6-N-acetylglucosaminyltransferase [Algoriphagus sp. PAP.12]|uniref:beta-1,6-N-acetylglucosaminyltransferase n=1 Tax=Algoriphagus sp. PAP.12 TaxID=2996678 RepID=UPI00227C4646|nr:beta-1,6-N-acetylglucosaminyltransferase [Algoriphagus sp. PAP.12]